MRSAVNISWGNPKIRAVVYQLLVLALIGFGVGYLLHNTLHNLQTRNISAGFGFLSQEAGFEIGESMVDYQPSDTYARAILVGLLNTLKVSTMAIVFSTILGVLIGLSRLSHNFLLSRLSALYVEVVRNIPLIIQLFFWYVLITESLPTARQAWNISDLIFLSNRGLYFPTIEGASLNWIGVGFCFTFVASVIFAIWARSHQDRTGQVISSWAYAIFLVFPVLAYVLSGQDLSLNIPHLKGFNFRGGAVLTPELTALLVGLVVYSAAFIAEIVRSGVSSIDRGQWEAASAIGLRRVYVLRLVILPLSLRVIIPPLTSNYLNIVKNSSLAIAIGYPDLVSVVNTVMNQTGQSIEGVAIIMAAYLVVSISISLFMNWYNKHIALVER